MKIIKKIKKFDIGYLKIKPCVNNIFITLTDVSGKVLLAKNAGILKFRGTKKRTPYIASLVAKDIIFTLRNLNLKFKGLIIQLSGVLKRNWSFKNIMEQLFELDLKNVFYIRYIVKQTHNGLRKKKKTSVVTKIIFVNMSMV